MRTTIKILESRVAYLNRIMSRSEKPYIRDADGNLIAQIGCYHLSQAYGGVALHCMYNEGGGVTDVFGYHMPKAEFEGKLNAFIRGIELAKEEKKI